MGSWLTEACNLESILVKLSRKMELTEDRYIEKQEGDLFIRETGPHDYGGRIGS